MKCAIRIAFVLAVWSVGSGSAPAGPPFSSDDPLPTEHHHYEIYLFAHGVSARDGQSGAGGVDFNYGAGPNLQLTAVLPVGWDAPRGETAKAGLSNIELAAKYRFLHQQDFGLDVAVFPRVFLPASSGAAGEQHVSLLLPLWLGKSWGKWTTFGGGGCVLNLGKGAQDYCLGGWAITREVLPRLQLGAEITHQGADTKGGRHATTLGGGLTFDLDEHHHLLAYFAPGVQNTGETGRYNWYTSFLFTF